MANEEQLGLFIKSIIDSAISEIGNEFEQEICKLKTEEDTQLSKGYKVADKGRGKVIGEYVCDRIDTYTFHKGLTRFGGELGLPIGTYDTYLIFEDDYNAMCLTYNEVKDYGKGKTLYGWHISDLKIYDKPKELWNFNYPCTEKECSKCQYEVREELPFDEIGVCCGRYHITRPFQSYGYVEPLEEIN